MQTLFIAVVSYFAAVFTFLVLSRLANIPKGGLWDEGGFRVPLLFVLLALAIGVMLVPFFQRENGAGIRTLSLFCGTFLGLYALFHASGAVDPDIPLDAFIRYVVEPLRRTLHF